MKRLVFIILSQFLAGSIWFAGNVAFAGQGLILSVLQAGFILGTFGFALLNISDRFSPVRVFFTCAFFGAVLNFFGLWVQDQWLMLALTRLGCGICLAGIYPVGMKIAAAWYPDTISRALGFLVGALVLASGFPHLISALGWQSDPGVILGVTSLACLAGGLIQLVLVQDGPHLPRAARFNFRIIKEIFFHPGFRAASLGYWGHMWELYALFAYVPLLLAAIAPAQAGFWAFGFFAAGCAGCVLGGLWALKWGSRKVALTALFLSGFLCLVSPLFGMLPGWAGIGLILIWGAAAAMDSPQFSALNTRFAPKEYVGSALTLVNCLGFLITIVTIELLGVWVQVFGIRTAFVLLAPGPFLGWVFLKKYRAG